MQSGVPLKDKKVPQADLVHFQNSHVKSTWFESDLGVSSALYIALYILISKINILYDISEHHKSV